MSQLTSPQNEGLFQRAIVESGIFTYAYPTRSRFGRRVTLQDAEKMGEAFFTFLGVKSLEEARAIDAWTLKNKIREFGAHWGTVEDGQGRGRF